MVDGGHLGNLRCLCIILVTIRKEASMNLQAIQKRFPWLMKPVELVEILVTPRRWPFLPDHVASRISDALVVDTTGLGRLLSRTLGMLSPVRSLLLSRSPSLQNLDWQVRKTFWALAWSTIVALQRYPRRAPVPRDEKPLALISAPESYPDFKAPALVVPADVPDAEKSLMTDVAVQIIHLLQDVYPTITSHQPVASSDPKERLEEAYTIFHRLVRTPPRWHPDLVQATRDNTLFAALAVGGPFAKLLERVSPDSERYVIDLSHMSNYPVRQGLCRLGSKLHFVASDGNLSFSGIEYENDLITPGSPRWEVANRIALAALMTHLTVWRQGMEYHAGGLAPVPVPTHNMPAAHPLRRLLAAHMAQMLQANYSTHITLRRSGWDARALSFEHETLLRYYDDGARAFDIRRLDVRADAERRNIPDTLDYPYLPQAIQYWDVIESYVRAYVEHYYADDRSLQADAHAQTWFDALDRLITGGIRSYVPTLTKSNLVKLCTLIIYSVSVAHTENSLWNYAPFMPTTVRKDGVGDSVGEVQMTLNFELLITSPMNPLVQDISHLALDRGAAEIMRGFQASLRKLQRDMENEPDRYWRLYPNDVEASVST